MSRVSVVIPLHNDALRIDRAIRSVLKQSDLNEIIVVDDCSSDDSRSVADALCGDTGLVRVVGLEENSGPAAARNFGADIASGEFLCFLDSDDEFLGNYFADVVPMLDANPEMHAFKVGMEYFDPIKGYILPSYDPRYQAVVFSSACNVIVRRKSFMKMGGFSTDPAFRAAHGGEDAAYCSALAQFFPPLGRVDRAYYRCWSCSGSHVDKFLANTRLAGNPDGFEFVTLSVDQEPGGRLAQALHLYNEEVRTNLGK